mgnify:CR=1 FL=1|jgi:hypothetical protein
MILKVNNKDLFYIVFYMIVRMNVCEYLNYFEEETWQRIAFTRKTSLSNIRETTLTENLVFNLFRIGQAQSNVLIFESENETRNGNDLEIIIHKNG